MAHSFQIEQQKQLLLQGIYEWKVENASEITEDRWSPVFKFDINDCFLRLRYQISSTNGRQSMNLKIDLVSAALLSGIKSTFTNYIESCFISCNGIAHFNTTLKLSHSFYTSIDVMSWTVDYMVPRFEIFNELLEEGMLTFRLAWSDDIDILHCNIQQKTSSNLLKGKNLNMSLEKLSKDFEDFYENKMITDCVLTTGGETLSVHRSILCARSSVFAAMFRHDTFESQSGVVDMKDVNVAVLKDVLHYIYTGQTRGLTSETVFSMHTVADKYGLAELSDNCLLFLMYNLTIDNVTHAIELALLHEVSELEKEISVFIKENSKELQNNNNWIEFAESNPHIAIQYLHSALETDSQPQAKKPKL